MPRCQRCGFEPPDPRARFCPSCGVMLEGPKDPDDPLIGRVVGERYRVTGLVGQGGMGRVYRAEQKMGTSSRTVAIKALHGDLASDPAVARRFNREAETVVKLGHPNTITFYDFGQTPDGTLYIVMEHIEGESLSKVVKRGPLPLDRALGILEQICGSLHEAHEKGIVHRDLKPDNIILTRRAGIDDFVKVLDFGIAKRTEVDVDSLTLTKAGFVLGTPPYMSPEQFTGQRLDRRSDVYSLGVLTYEMLTGSLPFGARTPWDWATQHMTAEPIPMARTAAGASLPENVRRAVHGALAKDPGARPQTASAFMSALAGSGPSARLGDAGATAPATPVEPPGRATRPWQEPPPAWSPETDAPPREARGRRGRAAAFAVLAVVGGVAAVLGLLWLLHDRPVAPPPAPQPSGLADAAPGPRDAEGGPALGQDGGPVDGGGDGEGGATTALSPAATAAARQVEEALRRGDIDSALDLLPGAEQLAGRASPEARALGSAVRAAVAERVGRLVARRDCEAASALYLRARRANAHRSARGHFAGSRCPSPD